MLERLVGGVVLAGLLLLLALVVGPREELRMPGQEGSESSGGQDVLEPPQAAVAALPDTGHTGRGQAHRDAAPEWISGDPASGVVSREASPAAPPPVAESGSPAPAAAGAAGWGVQLGSFAKRDNATRLSDWCREQGYDVKIVVFPQASGTLHHRVRVGPFATRDKAKSVEAQLALQGRSAFVTNWNDEQP